MRTEEQKYLANLDGVVIGDVLTNGKHERISIRVIYKFSALGFSGGKEIAIYQSQTPLENNCWVFNDKNKRQ